MEESTSRQSWETCRYSKGGVFPSKYWGDKNIEGILLNKYMCTNLKVIELVMKFNNYRISKSNGKPVVILYQDTSPLEKKLEYKELIFAKPESAEHEQNMIKRALAGCKHCKFYEKKKT